MSDLVDRLRKKYLEEDTEKKNDKVIVNSVQKKAEAMRNKTYLPIQKTQTTNKTTTNKRTSLLPSARTRFQSDNAEKLKTAREVSDEEKKGYSFDKFKSNFTNNPNKAVSILSDIGSGIQASRINTGIATEKEKRAYEKLNLYQGLSDSAVGIGSILSNFSGEYDKTLGKILNNNELYERGNKIQNMTKAISTANNYSNKVTSKLEDGAYKTGETVKRTLASMSPSIALSALTGGMTGLGSAGTFLAKNSGALLQAGGVVGNEMTETLNEDNSNFTQAAATGALKGGVEYGTEKLFGGNILAKGTSIDKIVTKGIANNVKSKVGKILLSKGYELAGEQIEEFISDNAGYVIDKLINDKEIPEFKEWINNTGETAKTTFLTTLVLQSLGLGGGTYNEVKETNLSDKEKADIQKWVTEADKITNNTTQKQNNTQGQQITQSENKMPQNQFSEQINSNSIETAKNNKIDINSEEITPVEAPTETNYENIPLQQDVGITEDTRGINTILQETFSLDKKQTQELYDKVTNTNSVEQTRQVLEDYKDINETVVNEQVKEIRNTIRKTKLDVNKIKNNITDYNAWRQSNFGKLKIGNDGLAVDSFYQELVTQYPGYFDSNITDTTDQLEALSDFMNNNQSKYTQKIGEISDSDLNSLSEKVYAEVHANEFNKSTQGAYKDIDNIIDSVQLKEDIAPVKEEATNYYKEYKEKWKDKYKVSDTNSGQLSEVHFTNLYEMFKTNNIDTSLLDYIDDHQIGLKKEYRTDKEGNKHLIRKYNDVELIKEIAERNKKESMEEIKQKEIRQEELEKEQVEIKQQKERIIKENGISEKQYEKMRESEFYREKKQRELSLTSNEIKGRDSGYYNGKKSIRAIRAEMDGKFPATEAAKMLGVTPKSITDNLLADEWHHSGGDMYNAVDYYDISQYIELAENGITDYVDDISYEVAIKNWLKMINSKKTIEDFKNIGNGKTIQELKLPLTNNKKTNTSKNISKVDLTEGEEALNKIYEKEKSTTILPTTKILDKYRNNKIPIKKEIDAIIQTFVNRGHYIHKLAKRTGNYELDYKYDRMLNAQAEGQYNIGVAQTNNKGEVIGKSVNNIWKPVEEARLVKEFNEYLLHRHNMARETENKPIFGQYFSSNDSKIISEKYENNYPQFSKWAKDIYKFNQNNLDNMVEAGLISESTKQLLNELYPNYVTISRQIDELLREFSNQKTGTNAPLKKAQFASADIKPLKDSMEEQVIRIKKLIRTNEVGLELRKSLKNSEVKTNYDEVYSPSELFNLESTVEADSKGNKYCIIFEDGIAKKININDDIYISMKPSTPYSWEQRLPFKMIQKASSVHRALLTSDNPIFIMTNFFKDVHDGAFNSKYSSKFLKNYGVAVKEIVTNGELYNKYMANGGSNNTYFDYSTGAKKQGGNIQKFLGKIRYVNELVEQAPRLAEFKSTLDAGKSIDEAMYNAAEVTTNFKRGGDITKALNRNGANFLNASVQGLSKQFRNLTGQNGVKGYTNLLIKATLLGVAPAILNHILLGDDEDYEDLPQSTKDLYYLFKCNDNSFVRIPKGRVVSIFGAIARRTLEAVQGQEDAFTGFTDTIINQVAPNNPIEDNILAPISQVSNNKTWYGSDLVPERLQDELPKNQYDEKTDVFSKWLGEKLNVSPIKINYVLDQYSGGIGDVILPMLTPEAKENVLVDKFTTNSVLKNKNVSKFFDTIEKQTQINNDTEVSDEDIIKLKYLNSRKSETSDLYKEKREIQMSNISNEEKKKKVLEIQEKINDIMEDALSKYNDTKVNKNSATVSDEQYIRDSKGNWEKITEEEAEKNKNISLETYADYKTKLYSRKNELIKEGTIKSTGSVPNTEKNKILANSNYSEKEKLEIYCNYISTQDKKVKLLVENGISINDYLNLKSQNFEADKDENGNVIKSKKEKVYEYLNKNKTLSLQKKAILLKVEGYNEYNDEIIKYVKNSKLSSQKQKDFLEVLGFDIDENGKISWKVTLPITKYK